MQLTYGHIGLCVSDYQTAIDFYCGILGMKLKHARKDAQGRVDIAFLEFAPRMYLEIFPQYTACGPVEGQPYKHICFVVDNIDSVTDYLKSRGLELDGPRPTSSGDTLLFVCDPDGNRVEFNQLSPGSPI